MGGTVGVVPKWLFLKGLSTYFSAGWSIRESCIYIELSAGGQVRRSLLIASSGDQPLAVDGSWLLSRRLPNNFILQGKSVI